MSSTMMAMRASSDSSSAEQKRLAERRKGILILIHQHLLENGYIDAATKLVQEAGQVITKFEVADNMDLTLILGEYESYYEMRFDKKPKLIRKLDEGSTKPGATTKLAAKRASSKSSSVDISYTGYESKDSARPPTNKLPQVTGASASGNPEDDAQDKDKGPLDFGVQGTTVKQTKKVENEKVENPEDRVLKPPPQFGGNSEMKALANIISQEIYQESPNVFFSDIVKLDGAKRLLAEAVQLPIRFPSLFTGILKPWKGILLHGPPGTGKTLLAKAVATECNTTFFNISASTLVSKWRGDSEKLVRCLFEVARYHGPSTIFLDEIDSILTSRSGEGGGQEHEASRRMKTELLIQMDGVRGSKPNELVFVMAASNLPWDLDVAVLRRLEKRVLVPLPEAEAREVMFRKHLADRSMHDLDYAEIGSKTNGYSGADIELVCREAAMMPVRRLMTKILALDVTNGPAPDPPSKNGVSRGRTLPKAAESLGPSNEEVADLLKADPVTTIDIAAALETTKPSSDGKMDKYEDWQNEFGSV